MLDVEKRRLALKTKLRKYKGRIADIMYEKGTLLNQNKDRNFSYNSYMENNFSFKDNENSRKRF